MRLVVCLLPLLLLPACTSTGGLDITVAGSDLAVVIADVQALTKSACAVIPIASAIENIVDAGDPTLTTASAIANIICKAVGQAPASLRARLSLKNAKKAVWVPAPVIIDGVTVTFKAN